ncbi:MAG: hypothetical protein IKO00_07460 [Oscillospiraceae bacterium]|nr:hypothetical protein [Oscillospiraceae bacterium]
MTDREIYNFYRAAGMTAEGAAGFEANLDAESTLRPDNAEDARGIPDAQYVAEVDAGTRNFLDDIGFGYAQWTEKTRKRKLLAYAKECGTSIADPMMQLRFSVLELQADFPSIWRLLTTSHDLLECTKQVLYVYENPQVKNLGTRYAIAQKLYAKFAGEPEPAPYREQDAETTAIVRMLQTCMVQNGFWPEEQINGVKSAEFRRAFVEYANAVAKS